MKVPITVLREADRSFLKVNVTMTATTEGGTFVRSGVIIAHTSGVLDIQVRAIGDLEPMAPRDIVTAQVEVENLGLMARAFGAEIVSNPCGLDVAPPPGTTLAKSEKRDISFDIQAPADKPWYYYQNCDLQVDFFAVDNTAARKSISYSVVVDGFYVDPGWVITIVAWAILIFLGLLVAKGIRDRRQELVHAKPQKPWLIPIERVYLDQLKKEDPRAWYVVRHFLMEDEYRSALAWWHSYRAADKGGLSKERLILKEEASYAAWKEQWDRRIAAPLAKAEKKEAALLRKLRKKAAKAHRQAAKKSQADNAKIEAADAKRNAREVASWEKQAAKAKKKGRPAPPRPAVQRSPLTDAPAVKQVTLEGHRYGRKAERIRKRAIRKQGNLEVRFENADARRQERMQRKIEKLAQKLDDPQFAREHGVT